MASLQSVIITEWVCAIIAGIWLRVQAGPLYKDLVNKNLVDRRPVFTSLRKDLEDLEAKTTDCEIKIKVNRILMYKELSNSIIAGGFLLSSVTCLIGLVRWFMR